MRFFINLPQTQGSDHVSRTHNNHCRKNRRHQQIHLRPAEHVSREAKNLRREINRNPDGALCLALGGEIRSRSDRRDERSLRSERGHRHDHYQDCGPRGGVDEQRPPRAEVLEYGIESGEIHFGRGNNEWAWNDFEFFCVHELWTYVNIWSSYIEREGGENEKKMNLISTTLGNM